VRIAKEELKRARKRLKEAKREARRARKHSASHVRSGSAHAAPEGRLRVQDEEEGRAACQAQLGCGAGQACRTAKRPRGAARGAYTHSRSATTRRGTDEPQHAPCNISGAGAPDCTAPRGRAGQTAPAAQWRPRDRTARLRTKARLWRLPRRPAA